MYVVVAYSMRRNRDTMKSVQVGGVIWLLILEDRGSGVGINRSFIPPVVEHDPCYSNKLPCCPIPSLLPKLDCPVRAEGLRSRVWSHHI